MTRHQLKPQPTAHERIAAKRKLQEAPGKDYYLAQKVKTLKFDYKDLSDAQREMAQQAALDIRSRLKRTVEDVIAIGKQLIEVKALIPGRFMEWLEAEFGMSDRSARNFMYSAEKLGDKMEIISILDVTTVYLLAAPSTPDTVRWEVLERMELTNYRPTHAQVKAIIGVHKPPRPKQLPGPVAEPEPGLADAIEAEYTVLASATVHPAISRALALKLQDAVLHRIMRSLLTPAEQDELLVALSKALEGEG